MQEKQVLKRQSTIQVPAMMVPLFAVSEAISRGIEKNLLLHTWGGLGDQICAEPTLRFALKTFKGCNISLATPYPELFSHLSFSSVFDLKSVQPLWHNYLQFDTIKPNTDIVWQFMSHMLVNCVDYCSLCAFRCMLPVDSKQIIIKPSEDDFKKINQIKADESSHQKMVAVHAGRHWASKTFPKDWWDEVLRRLIGLGLTPVLIGGDTNDNRGTVEVDATGCIDLRNRLTVMESVALLQRVHVLLTNDSAPLHMAASGDAWIGFVATCKHPDYISHWRHGEWAWREVNHGKGGVWDIYDYCPNVENDVDGEFVPESTLRSWLPDPEDFAGWAATRW